MPRTFETAFQRLNEPLKLHLFHCVQHVLTRDCLPLVLHRKIVGTTQKQTAKYSLTVTEAESENDHTLKMFLPNINHTQTAEGAKNAVFCPW